MEETERKPVTVTDKNYVKAAARFTGSVKCSLCSQSLRPVRPGALDLKTHTTAN